MVVEAELSANVAVKGFYIVSPTEIGLPEGRLGFSLPDGSSKCGGGCHQVEGINLEWFTGSISFLFLLMIKLCSASVEYELGVEDVFEGVS